MSKKEKTSKPTGKITPLMGQYFKVKAKYPDAIMLFRVGDFYETFGDDAETISKILGIVLTSRNNGGSKIPLAGFPYHSLDTYLPRLVKAGFRVAICEQLEKPSKERKLVRRGVTEVVTPGVAMNDKLLDHKSNNFLAAVHFGKKDRFGLSFLDISTGEFLVCEGDVSYVDKMLQSFNPTEVIYPKPKTKSFETNFGSKLYTYPLEDWIFTFDFAREKLTEHFEVNSLKGFGVEAMEMAQIAAGATLHYLASAEQKNLKHINNITRIQPDAYVWLDRFTIRNLELVHSPHESGVPLIKILDQTISPMGARLMKKWVVLPLKKKQAIERRQNIVTFFKEQEELKTDIEKYIQQIGDLERLVSRVPVGKITPREVVQLKKALRAIAPVKELLEKTKDDALLKIAEGLNPCPTLCEQIDKEIVAEPPANLNKGGVIADGYSEELDELRHIVSNSKEILLDIQKTEAERTGIASLKIGFNNVFGYYLEVTNKYKNQGLVPEHWVRKQTLTGSERYITDDLKKLESKILGAEEKILLLEIQYFEKLVMDMVDYIQPIQHNASLIARLDCLIAFANVAKKHNYCKPSINDSLIIDVKEGRHPVIEHQLPPGQNYVPNDVYLDNNDQQILMITGPNMAGKSAILRQTALICLMAQMGAFVPAKEASLGLIDKVFTRVGASDNISSGESTFMVEMNETASIMNSISERSLILLDEIGRGTSTYDGISIAWSIAEYLHINQAATPKTLFATHYHELNELANKFPRIKNYNIATKEVGQKVIFLRKLVPGGSHHSFGIHVAKMAGMPKSIVKRAQEILGQLEQKTIYNKKQANGTAEKLRAMPADNYQLSIFEQRDPQAEKLKALLEDLDINSMTPVECMLKLGELKDLLK